MNSWLTIDTGQKMCLNKLTFSFLSPPERKTRAWTSASWTSSASRTSRRTPSSSFASTSPMSRSSFTSTSTYSLGNRWRPTSTFKLSLNSKTVSWALESVLESTLYAFLPLLLPHFHLNGDNMFSFVTLRSKKDGKGKICCCLYLRGERGPRFSPLCSLAGVFCLGGAENGLLMLNDLVSPMERSYKSS